MVGKKIRIRLFSLVMAAVMLLSVTMTVGAIPTDVIDAKDEIATVDITQVYNDTEVDADDHNYAWDGTEVQITYKATLQMTEEMATYLWYRQCNLMDAWFEVCISMDMELLEFVDDTVTVTFTSTFLKPASSDNYYTYTLKSYENGFFTYEFTVDKEWVTDEWVANNGYISVPMELIVAYDDVNRVAYSYKEARAEMKDPDFDNVEAAVNWDSVWNADLMYADFSVEDWMEPITLELANMRVQDWVDDTVTSDRSTWKTVTASGTIDGGFAYVTDPAKTIRDLAIRDVVGFTRSLEFGNESTIEEWTSNTVKVTLCRTGREIDPIDPVVPESPWLNLHDHFAYIIGYPDGMVHPEGTITRAEVATIFFRMLTDEVRDEYWSKTNNYSDVNATDWFNNAISTLSNLGVIDGYPDGTFKPNGNITRAEFATIAVRFFEYTESLKYDEDAFADIGGHWANEYINMAYLLEIVSGYPDGTYRPQQEINRAEAMTIVNNTLRRAPCVEGIAPVEDHEDFITWPDNMDKTMWYYSEVQEATNSHDYTYFAEETVLGEELWVDILPVRDWAAFEKVWSDAHSAANPGEVVGHD